MYELKIYLDIHTVRLNCVVQVNRASITLPSRAAESAQLIILIFRSANTFFLDSRLYRNSNYIVSGWNMSLVWGPGRDIYCD
jgi:hypothetical protein